MLIKRSTFFLQIDMRDKRRVEKTVHYQKELKKVVFRLDYSNIIFNIYILKQYCIFVIPPGVCILYNPDSQCEHCDNISLHVDAVVENM